MNYPIYVHLIISFLGTLGFCLIFHVPVRHIFSASLGGAIGWVSYIYFTSNGTSPVAAVFLGACAVSIVAELFSRAGKEATTMFIIPGIIPLVPGAPLYYTMREIIDNDFENAAKLATQVVFMAGSIALAILLIASLTRLMVAIKLNFTS